MAAAIRLVVDAQPLISFTESLQAALKRLKAPLGLPDLPSELARAELGPAIAGEVSVRLEPSDAFLQFGSALLAGN